jgi:hypothetical protein
MNDLSAQPIWFVCLLTNIAVAPGLDQGSPEPSHELGHIDDHPGMRAGPDLLAVLGRSHRKLDLTPIQFYHFGLPADQATNRRRSEMANIDGSVRSE